MSMSVISSLALSMGGVMAAIAFTIVISALAVAWRVLRPTEDLSTGQAVDLLLQLVEMLLTVFRRPPTDQQRRPPGRHRH